MKHLLLISMIAVPYSYGMKLSADSKKGPGFSFGKAARFVEEKKRSIEPGVGTYHLPSCFKSKKEFQEKKKEQQKRSLAYAMKREKVEKSKNKVAQIADNLKKIHKDKILKDIKGIKENEIQVRKIQDFLIRELAVELKSELGARTKTRLVTKKWSEAFENWKSESDKNKKNDYQAYKKFTPDWREGGYLVSSEVQLDFQLVKEFMSEPSYQNFLFQEMRYQIILDLEQCFVSKMNNFSDEEGKQSIQKTTHQTFFDLFIKKNLHEINAFANKKASELLKFQPESLDELEGKFLGWIIEENVEEALIKERLGNILKNYEEKKHEKHSSVELDQDEYSLKTKLEEYIWKFH